MKNNAPVALFVFNRTESLQKTIDCLQANNITNLWIFADGPRNTQEEILTDSVRDIVKNIGWTNPKLFLHEKNKGLSDSISWGLAEIFKEHDRAVIIEDDICIAPGFYTYVNQALNIYASDKNVMGVTGLRYPFVSKTLKNYPFDAFFTPRFSSWGWATWKDRWEEVAFELPKNRAAKDKLIAKSIVAGVDIPEMTQDIDNGHLTGCWDVFCCLHMVKNDLYFVNPKYNLVENTGLGKGTHATDVKPKWKLSWESRSVNESFKFSHDASPELIKDFQQFFINESIRAGESYPVRQLKRIRRKALRLMRGNSKGASK